MGKATMKRTYKFCQEGAFHQISVEMVFFILHTHQNKTLHKKSIWVHQPSPEKGTTSSHAAALLGLL